MIGFDGARGVDFGMVALKYPRGVSFIKTTACEHGGFARRRLVISGERGTIVINPLEWGPNHAQRAVMSECFDDAWGAEGVRTECEPFDRYDGMIYNFAELIRGKKNPYTYDYELKLYELVKKCSEV